MADSADSRRPTTCSPRPFPVTLLPTVIPGTQPGPGNTQGMQGCLSAPHTAFAWAGLQFPEVVSTEKLTYIKFKKHAQLESKPKKDQQSSFLLMMMTLILG